MKLTEIDAVRNKVPFVPFKIHLADHRSFRVPNRDHIWFPPGGRCVCIGTGDGLFEWVNALLISSLELTEEPDPPEEKKKEEE